VAAKHTHFKPRGEAELPIRAKT